MANCDWKTTATIFVMTLLVLKFFASVEQEHQAFEVSSEHIKYHANWTNSQDELHHAKQLKDSYSLSGVKTLDLSLAMSSLSFGQIKDLLPVRFKVYESIKLNFGNNPIGTEGADYILSLIPNGVTSLEISFDSINADDRLGAVLAKRLNNLNSLKKLKLSLIMAISSDTVLDDYLRFGRLSENLESYSLGLIGNSLSNASLGFLKTHLERANLKVLDLNFYANKLGAEGAETLAEAILSQKSLTELGLDLYFNNITEVGTEILSKSILEINNPELKTLHYNLDFNYIKNDGAKAVGNTLSKMKNLRFLSLGVASKNFGYLGFKHIVNGLGHLTDLQELSFKCGVNRVGGTGAEITRDLIHKLKKLKKISLNFFQNYVGDEGLIELTQAIASLEHVQSVYLNYGFNDAKGYSIIKIFSILAKTSLNDLYISFSSNEYQDSEVNFIKDELRQVIKNTKYFELQFQETAISKGKVTQLQELFATAPKPYGHTSKITVNSVISKETEAKYNETTKTREESIRKILKEEKEQKVPATPQNEGGIREDLIGLQEGTENREL